MKYKLAILNVLAASPGRHLTLDEVRHEAELLMALEGRSEQLKRFSALGEIDIFQSGLVLQDDAGLQITDAGRTLLHSLEDASETGPPKDGSGPPRAPGVSSEAGGVDTHESIDASILDGTARGNGLQPSPIEDNQPIAIEASEAAPQGVPEFLQRSFGSRDQEPSRNFHGGTGIFASMGAKTRLLFAPWRGHFAQDVPNPKTERPVGRVGGAAFALLSLFVIAACAAAVIAFVQIKSLKSEIEVLNRELLPLKERLGKLEQTEKIKSDSGEQARGQNKFGSEKNKAGGEILTDQTALNLSREEIQAIRDYIKPAPSAGPALPAINVGDIVGAATIPVPSQLMEKIPKLLGARFTTRNGSIIILRRDSRQADAVLPPR